MRIAIFSGRLINYAFSPGPSARFFCIASSSTKGFLVGQSSVLCFSLRLFLGGMARLLVFHLRRIVKAFRTGATMKVGRVCAAYHVCPRSQTMWTY